VLNCTPSTLGGAGKNDLNDELGNAISVGRYLDQEAEKPVDAR
jgi:hypothetical protein